MRRSMRFVLLGGTVALCLSIAVPAQAIHPRPKGASPMRLSLVPTYNQCTAPNRTHGPPLAFPSCNPPAQTSAQATVGTPDAFGGQANFSGAFYISVLVGVPGPPDDSERLGRLHQAGPERHPLRPDGRALRRCERRGPGGLLRRGPLQVRNPIH
jgi:hypothetical protein